MSTTNPSWLVDYVEHTKRQESPEIFHIWTALSIIAGTLGRKVWLPRRAGGVTHYNVYPGQLMVILTADSGLVRKTTALRPAEEFFDFIGKPVIQGKSSAEALLDQMDPAKGGFPQAVLIEGELTNFVSRQTYMEPIIDTLNALADGRPSFKFSTRKGGQIVIPEPCLTLLSATTPTNLGERLPTNAHGAGFLSRIIFVYAKETDREESLTDVEDEDLDQDAVACARATSQRLKDGINRINSMAGPYSFTKEGRKWFDTFYHEWRGTKFGQSEGYPSRKPDHLLRLAICFSAAGSSDRYITPISLNAARKLLSGTEANFDKVFMYVGTAFAKDRQRIVEFISTRGGVATTREIYNSLYVYFKDSETLRRTLYLLAEAGILENKRSKTNPPVESWTLLSVEFKL